MLNTAKRLILPLITASALIALPSFADEASSSKDPLNGQLPLQELRNFTEIFERIRTSYVE